MNANSLNYKRGWMILPQLAPSLFTSTGTISRATSWCFSLVCLLAFVWQAPAQGQSAATATIEGRVFDEISGNYLRNAVVSIEGTSLQTGTNAEGEYRVVNVPEGNVLLRVAYPGYRHLTFPVTTTAGVVLRQDASLTSAARAVSEVISLDAFAVQERQMSATAAALEEQRRAANIKNVVALEEIGDLGVSTPASYLLSVPGIATVNTTGEIGEISVRGMPPGGTLVTVDGLPVASSSPDSRTFSFFGSVTTNNVERIEVNKVPTPDLPANAIGGSVNMIEKSARSRKTPLLSYNLFGTFMAMRSPERLQIGLSKREGTDRGSSLRPLQPGFDLSYLRPINDSLAIAFTASRNSRLQDREYYIPTWNRVARIQTAARYNSVLNIFETNSVSFNLDGRMGRNTIRLGATYTDADANARQNNFTSNFGTGTAGGEDFSQGAASGVGNVTRTSADTNQHRTLLKTNLIYRYEFGAWKLDLGAIRSEATRGYTNIDDGIFGGYSANITQLVVGATQLSNIHRMAYPRYTAVNRAGATVDIFDANLYSLNSVSSNQFDFESVDHTVTANLQRQLNTSIPVTLKIGGFINDVSRDDRRDIRSWSFTPPNATTGGRLVGNYDLIAQGYSDRRVFDDGIKLTFLSDEKVFALYEQHPDWFVENLVTRHTNRVNNSKQIDETITAAYLRADVSLGRFYAVGGVRFEKTEDEGWGPSDDITRIYQRNSSGQIVRDAQGRPVRITTDALAIAQLQLIERGQYFKTKYSGWYPSLNARYNLTDAVVLRAGYARTIGRPDLGDLLPATTIPDPDGANRDVRVTSHGLEPWTSDNYDFTVETYQLKGATIGLSVFRKDVSNFAYRTIIPLTPELVALYSLPAELLTDGDWTLNSLFNSPDDARLNGFEWSWRQQLASFEQLPLWLRGVSVSASGTHIRVTGAGADNFENMTPKVISWSIAYRLKAFYADVRVYNSKGRRVGTVAASATVPPGAYQAEASRTMISTSLRYQISRRLALQLNVQNLTDSPYRQMIYAPGLPGYANPAVFRRLGIEYTLGIRGTF